MKCLFKATDCGAEVAKFYVMIMILSLPRLNKEALGSADFHSALQPVRGLTPGDLHLGQLCFPKLRNARPAQ